MTPIGEDQRSESHTSQQLEILAGAVRRFNPPLAADGTITKGGDPGITFINMEHRVSCHRCGNIRKKKLVCLRTQCPHIYCGRCVDKMKEEYGADVFVGGCPVCKELCCCNNKSVYCHRRNHCYRKCPSTKTTKAHSSVLLEQQQTHFPCSVGVVGGGPSGDNRRYCMPSLLDATNKEVRGGGVAAGGQSGIVDLLAAVAGMDEGTGGDGEGVGREEGEGRGGEGEGGEETSKSAESCAEDESDTSSASGAAVAAVTRAANAINSNNSSSTRPAAGTSGVLPGTSISTALLPAYVKLVKMGQQLQYQQQSQDQNQLQQLLLIQHQEQQQQHEQEQDLAQAVCMLAAAAGSSEASKLRTTNVTAALGAADAGDYGVANTKKRKAESSTFAGHHPGTSKVAAASSASVSVITRSLVKGAQSADPAAISSQHKKSLSKKSLSQTPCAEALSSSSSSSSSSVCSLAEREKSTLNPLHQPQLLTSPLPSEQQQQLWLLQHQQRQQLQQQQQQQQQPRKRPKQHSLQHLQQQQLKYGGDQLQQQPQDPQQQSSSSSSSMWLSGGRNSMVNYLPPHATRMLAGGKELASFVDVSGIISNAPAQYFGGQAPPAPTVAPTAAAAAAAAEYAHHLYQSVMPTTNLYAFPLYGGFPPTAAASSSSVVAAAAAAAASASIANTINTAVNAGAATANGATASASSLGASTVVQESESARKDVRVNAGNDVAASAAAGLKEVGSDSAVATAATPYQSAVPSVSTAASGIAENRRDKADDDIGCGVGDHHAHTEKADVCAAASAAVAAAGGAAGGAASSFPRGGAVDSGIAEGKEKGEQQGAVQVVGGSLSGRGRVEREEEEDTEGRASKPSIQLPSSAPDGQQSMKNAPMPMSVNTNLHNFAAGMGGFGYGAFGVGGSGGAVGGLPSPAGAAVAAAGGGGFPQFALPHHHHMLPQSMFYPSSYPHLPSIPPPLPSPSSLSPSSSSLPSVPAGSGLAAMAGSILPVRPPALSLPSSSSSSLSSSVPPSLAQPIPALPSFSASAGGGAGASMGPMQQLQHFQQMQQLQLLQHMQHLHHIQYLQHLHHHHQQQQQQQQQQQILGGNEDMGMQSTFGVSPSCVVSQTADDQGREKRAKREGGDREGVSVASLSSQRAGGGAVDSDLGTIENTEKSEFVDQQHANLLLLSSLPSPPPVLSAAEERPSVGKMEMHLGAVADGSGTAHGVVKVEEKLRGGVVAGEIGGGGGNEASHVLPVPSVFTENAVLSIRKKGVEVGAEAEVVVGLTEPGTEKGVDRTTGANIKEGEYERKLEGEKEGGKNGREGRSILRRSESEACLLLGIAATAITRATAYTD